MYSATETGPSLSAGRLRRLPPEVRRGYNGTIRRLFQLPSSTCIGWHYPIRASTFGSMLNRLFYFILPHYFAIYAAERQATTGLIESFTRRAASKSIFAIKCLFVYLAIHPIRRVRRGGRGILKGENLWNTPFPHENMKINYIQFVNMKVTRQYNTFCLYRVQT